MTDPIRLRLQALRNEMDDRVRQVICCENTALGVRDIRQWLDQLDAVLRPDPLALEFMAQWAAWVERTQPPLRRTP